jgi:Trypsin-co-occurring domain 1
MERVSRDHVLVDAVLPNGVAVKVSALSTNGAHDVSLTGAFKLDNIRDAISGIAEMAKDSTQKLSPHDVEIEFGLGLTVEAGKLVSLLTSAATDASLIVRLRWHRSPESLPIMQGEP